MVKVQDSDKVVLFQNPTEKAELLLEWDLVSSTYVLAQKYLKDEKTFKYYYNNSNQAQNCEVVGYIMYPNNNGKTAVVKVNNDLLKIMPAHLKEMQQSAFIS